MIRNSLDALNEIVEKLGTVTDADYIYANKTFTVPTNVTRLFIQAWGAGGGGGSVPSTAYPSGGGGAYSEGWLTVTPGQTIACTVGIGGLGGVWVSAPGADGVAGGSTSVGSFITVAGGFPGTATEGSPGIGGGIGTMGSFNAPGGNGLSTTGGGHPGIGFMMPANIRSITYPYASRGFIACGGWGNINSSGTQGGDGLIIIRWYK